MNRKRILRGLLFPPAWVLCVLPPAAFASLTAAAVRGMPDCTALYFLYGLSAYALMLWALAVPRFLRTVHRLRAWVRTTRWGGRYLTDIRFRGTVRMMQGTVVNLLYVAFRTATGIRYGSRWFRSLAAYYFLLALTRAFLLLGLRRRAARQDPLASGRRGYSCLSPWQSPSWRRRPCGKTQALSTPKPSCTLPPPIRSIPWRTRLSVLHSCTGQGVLSCLPECSSG